MTSFAALILDGDVGPVPVLAEEEAMLFAAVPGFEGGGDFIATGSIGVDLEMETSTLGSNSFNFESCFAFPRILVMIW
jgi:hypothetical protein